MAFSTLIHVRYGLLSTLAVLVSITFSQTNFVFASPPGKRESHKDNHVSVSNTKSSKATNRTLIHKPLPESLTSFGAAVLGDYLYVFSGHSGDAHGAGRDLLVDHFRRIKVNNVDAKWEELAKHEPAQSTALVTDGKFLYRIGGLTFLNGSGEETNFKSTQHFARYDVKKNEWTELAPLPEPRSSLDAAVLGQSIYVAGGWNLQGKSSREAPWHDHILKYDLDNPDAGWQSIEGPGYNTRALSVAAHDGKLYLLGGIQQRGITKQVSVYDPTTKNWSKGPELNPDSAAAGFATSSFATGGHLYYTGGSGVVYKLNDKKTDWEVADRLLFPRMFLRLLPLSDNQLIALGGTSMSAGRVGVVESLRVDAEAENALKQTRWTVPFDGRAKHSQTLVLDGFKLYAFGGNASRAPHDFSEDAFVDEAFVFDIARQSAKELPNLPLPMQSGCALVTSQTSEHQSIIVAGGMGVVEGKFSSLKDIFRFDPESKSWNANAAALPQPRSMFSAVNYEDAAWFFGGSSVGKKSDLLKSVIHWWGDDSQPTPLPGVSVPIPRRSFGGAVLDDEYFMVGGLTKSSGIAKTVDVFHFNNRTWRKAASPNVPRVFPSLVAASGRLYLFGGFTNADGHFQPAKSLEMYNPVTNQWKTIAKELSGVDSSMTMLSMSNRLLFYGIDKEKDGLANFVLFDPAPKTIPEKIESMGFGRRQRDPAEQSKREAMSLMRKDVNKDGKLSKQELGKRMFDFFQDTDQNADGFVTFSEAATAIETRIKNDELVKSQKKQNDSEKTPKVKTKEKKPKTNQQKSKAADNSTCEN